jgi:hypothetical protein
VTRGTSPVVWAGRAYALAVSGLIAVDMVAPQPAGPIAIAQILAPHLALTSIVFVAPALRRDRGLRLALVLLAILFAVRFGDDWVSLPSRASSGDAIRVAT